MEKMTLHFLLLIFFFQITWNIYHFLTVFSTQKIYVYRSNVSCMSFICTTFNIFLFQYIAQVRDQTMFSDFPRDSKEETNFWNVLIDTVHET